MYIVFDRNKIYLCDDYGTKIYKYNKKLWVYNRHSISLAIKDVFANKKHFFYTKITNSDVLTLVQRITADDVNNSVNQQQQIKDELVNDVLNSLLFKFYPQYFKTSNTWYVVALATGFANNSYVYLCQGDDDMCSSVCKFTHNDCKTSSLILSKSSHEIVVTYIKNGKFYNWSHSTKDKVRWVTVGDELRYDSNVVDINHEPQLVNIMIRSKYEYLFDWVSEHRSK